MACLIIVYVHWITFLLNPNGSAEHVHVIGISDYQSAPLIDWIMRGAQSVVPFDFREVYFALGLFFLISGFVIPLSMRNVGRLEFLVKRLLRIYPVVIVCTLIAFASIALDRSLTGLAAAPVDFRTLFSNALLLRDYRQLPFVDPSVWTLEVEMHFYLLCFALGIRRGLSSATVLIVAASLYCIAAYCTSLTEFQAHFKGVVTILTVLGKDGCFVTLMLIGTALFNRVFGAWTLRKTLLCVLVLAAANRFCLGAYPQMAGEPGEFMYANHILAILFFVALLLAGPRLPYVRWLDLLANVSYPLYLLHGAAAYAVFFTAFRLTGSTLVAGIVAAASVAIATYLVHVYVENVGIAIGKRLGRRPTPQPTAT